MTERRNLRPTPILKKLAVTLLAATCLVVLAACGGGSDSGSDDEATSAPAATETPAAEATTSGTTPTGTTPAPAATSQPTAAATPASGGGTAAVTWTREVCKSVVAYRKQAELTGAAIRTAAGSGNAAKATVLAEYERLLTELVAYSNSVSKPPVPSFDGGRQVQETWSAWVADSVIQLKNVIASVNDLPDGAEFGPAYQQFVADADDDFADQSFGEDMQALVGSFPDAGKVLETLNNDAACR